VIKVPIVSEQHREERKSIILDAAKEVFITKGVNATRMQDIIEASKVSRGGVYTYFNNTEDIFIEILRRRDSEDILDFNHLFEGKESNWAVLNSLIDGIAQSIANQEDKLVPAIYEYYFTIAWKSKKHLPSLETRIEQVKEIFACIIRKGIQENEFKSDIPVDDVARTIITFCDGLNLSTFHLGPEKVSLRNQFEVFKAFLKNCLFATR
jgi:AcrR family transcriptional regulator